MIVALLLVFKRGRIILSLIIEFESPPLGMTPDFPRACTVRGGVKSANWRRWAFGPDIAGRLNRDLSPEDIQIGQGTRIKFEVLFVEAHRERRDILRLAG